MGKLISFAIVAVIAFAVWQGLNGLFEGSKLQGVMNDTAENARNHGAAEITQELIDRAKQAQIPIKAEQVKVEISFDAKTDVAGTMTSQRGIVANQKHVVITARHIYSIFGLEMGSDIKAVRNFTMGATMPTRQYE